MSEPDPPPKIDFPSHQRRLKVWLSQPWIGPSISLVVLAVGLLGLGFNVAGYLRQGWRWAAEDASRVLAQITVQPELNDGYRRGYVELYPGREPMRISKVEIVEPPGSEISLLSESGKTESGFHGSFEVSPPRGLTSEGRALLFVMFRTPKPVPQDVGSVIEIIVTAVELSGEQRVVERRAKAIIH